MNEVSPYFIQRNQEAVQPPNGHLNGWNKETDQSERILGLVRKHRWTLVATSVAAVVLALIWFFTRTPMYSRKRDDNDSAAGAASTRYASVACGTDQQDLEHDYYKTQYEILTTRSLAARVIHDLDLEHNPFFSDKPRRAFLAH